MTLATITQHVATLAKANQRRLLAYKQGGGTDTRYLDGKAAAYREVAQALALVAPNGGAVLDDVRAAREAEADKDASTEEATVAGVADPGRTLATVAKCYDAALDDWLDAKLTWLGLQEQQQLLKDLIWVVFGDIAADSRRAVLRPDRDAAAVDVRAVVTTLRQAFWPETYPDDDAAGDHQPAEGT